jgi:predicted MFS family arabinose efflux permease
VSRINPTVRGLAIIVLIAVVITVLNLQNSVLSLLLIARIAFFLAIAFFLFLLWRDRREEISMWGARSQAVFYGAIALGVANTGIWILTEYPHGSLQTLGAIGVFVACGYALWRTWRQEHSYSY